MNDAFLHGYKHLMKSWKILREQINNEIDDFEQLKLVTTFWSLAPLSIRALDWDKPETWPDPWQLIHSQSFDESAISLAMFYTLLLSKDKRWNTNRLALILVKDSQRHIQKIVLKVDDRWFMNLDYNFVVDSKSTSLQLTKQQLYVFDGKTHKVYDKRKIIKVIDNVGSSTLNTKPRKNTER